MKKLFCALMALLLLCTCACAAGNVRVGFEDGFALELPDGWQFYAPTEEMEAQGVLYCLSDASAACWLYIQRWGAECESIDDLLDLITSVAEPDTAGAYSFNGVDCVVYDLAGGDVSCCAALVGSQVINFVFTPQSDATFMVAAAQIMGSLELV